MTTSATRELHRQLRRLAGAGGVVDVTERRYLSDATEAQGLVGRADAICLPRDTQAVVDVAAWCYDNDLPIIPRGGGTGYAGGAVPVDGGVVVSMERLTAIRSFDPLLWRMQVDAGVTTATVRRLARENGLYFPPDPGAAEQSHIGGNIATNAGGPHAFKYGVTGRWITGIEAVVPAGELISVGGPIRKDVAGYDIKSLLVGSEGTLGIITSAWLTFIPAPEAAFPVAAFYEDAAAGCQAVEMLFGNGIAASAIEFFDAGAIDAAGASFPGRVDSSTRFIVLAESDGWPSEAERVRGEMLEVLRDGAVGIHAPRDRGSIDQLWRWREGVSLAVRARRGGKMSEDVVVPVEHLRRVVDETVAIGRRHDLEACSWGHAGDGNVHATFLLEPQNEDELVRATAAADDLFSLTASLGGSVTGEHGVGWVKRGELARQWTPAALALHERVKSAFDPKGLINPGKKRAR